MGDFIVEYLREFEALLKKALTLFNFFMLQQMQKYNHFEIATSFAEFPLKMEKKWQKT
jgi:hypothetical protein